MQWANTNQNRSKQVQYTRIAYWSPKWNFLDQWITLSTQGESVQRRLLTHFSFDFKQLVEKSGFKLSLRAEGYPNIQSEPALAEKNMDGDPRGSTFEQFPSSNAAAWKFGFDVNIWTYACHHTGNLLRAEWYAVQSEQCIQDPSYRSTIPESHPTTHRVFLPT